MIDIKEKKERFKDKSEKKGGYFLNLSQLTFAAVVLGGVPALFGASSSTLMASIKIIIGIIITIVFAIIGNKILK